LTGREPVKYNHPGNLVESLSSRIVARAAKHLVSSVPVHRHKFSMAPRHSQAQHRRIQLCMSQKVRVDVPLNVVDAHQGDVGCECQPLCRRKPHKQSAYQARPVGNRHGINPGQRDFSFVQSLVDYWDDRFHVATRGDLGHDPSKLAVHFYLRRHHR
jgi:hypothetical protein